MSSKGLTSKKSTKRKNTESSDKSDSLKSKKPKLVSGDQNVKPHFGKPKSSGDKGEHKVSLSKKELRIQAKELTEARKKKRKPHYSLEQELGSLWEKMRRRDIGKEERSKKPKLVSGDQNVKPHFGKPKSSGDKGEHKVSLSKKELRIQAKELTEARKKKRKPHYSLEQELGSLWEKMRRRDIGKEERSKKPKLVSGDQNVKPHFGKPKSSGDKGEHKVSLSKKELRIQAKELTEARKKKRKPHYSLEQELGSLWEKMRRRDIGKEERSKLVSEAIRKMKGKVPEIAGSHVSSRVLQTCVKFCSQAERDTIFAELQPHFLTLASNKYAVFLLKKMLDGASKQQLADCISSLRGRVARLLRHMFGSVVVEHAYHLGTAAQKQELLAELYSTELQLFKGLASTTEKRVVDIIAKLGLQKDSVNRHMAAIIQPILEKGIVDHTIIHKLLIEYLTIADKTSAADVLQLLTGSLILRMVHTRDGSRLAMLCIKHGSAKERKKIIKAMKDHVQKVAFDQFGSMVLACIFSIVDDTKLVTKIIVRELEPTLKDLVMDKNGRRSLLQLLRPNSSRYFSHDDLASLDLSVPSLCSKDKSETSSLTKDTDGNESGEETKDEQEDTVTEHSDHEENVKAAGGKKDPLVRRRELLVNSGLAESLIDVCVENAEEFLKSNIGKEVLYEVAVGGADGILCPSLSEKLGELYEAISSVAAKPKPQESEKDSEHILENFHSSRTIRRLVLDCPGFASTLFKKALSGKCRSWAAGHCSKILSAFLESEDLQVREMAKPELQVLVNEGTLKISASKKPE